MISYSPRRTFDWITVQMCFAEDKSKTLLSPLETRGSGLTSQKAPARPPACPPPTSRRPCVRRGMRLWFSFAGVWMYMRPNAWQRSCLRSPAIKNQKKKRKKAQGAKGGGEGGEKKAVQGGRRGEGGVRGGVCFFSGAKLLERRRRGKAGEWERRRDRACTQPRRFRRLGPHYKRNPTSSLWG